MYSGNHTQIQSAEDLNIESFNNVKLTALNNIVLSASNTAILDSSSYTEIHSGDIVMIKSANQLYEASTANHNIASNTSTDVPSSQYVKMNERTNCVAGGMYNISGSRVSLG